VLDFDFIRYGFMDNTIMKSSYCLESAIWENENPKIKTNCTAKMNQSFIQESIKKCQGLQNGKKKTPKQVR